MNNDNLKQQLWNIACLLRNRMNADEYKNYILGFIFYKYLSDKQYKLANYELEPEEVKDYLDLKDEELIDKIRQLSIDELGCFLRPEQLFRYICRKGENEFILDDLTGVLKDIEQGTIGTKSEDDFSGLFDDIDLSSNKLGSSPSERNKTIVMVMKHLMDVDLSTDNSDVIGNAYEYLLKEFASGSNKGAGEFYTPQEVSIILSRIVTTDRKKIKSAYDPTTGSGSLLLRIKNETEVSDLYGQERNPTTHNLARMNMILHGVHFDKFDIQNGDTLKDPKHSDMFFDAIVANPPFSTHWEGKDYIEYANDPRFKRYGKLAPKTKADYAFIQHMIYHLKEDGIMACVAPHGVLFRGAAEGVIRKYLIEDMNCLDAVIGLPANIFFGTSIPTCILVFKKCRKEDQEVLFIDASGEDHFDKQKNQNILRTQDIDQIVTTYRNRLETPKYSHKASLEEIAENDYNLNIPRYVDTFEEEEPINMKEVCDKIKLIDEDIHEVNDEISNYCFELNISTPF